YLLNTKPSEPPDLSTQKLLRVQVLTEPISKLELETCGLRNRCSTTELNRRRGAEDTRRVARVKAEPSSLSRGHLRVTFRVCARPPASAPGVWCYGCPLRT